MKGFWVTPLAATLIIANSVILVWLGAIEVSVSIFYRWPGMQVLQIGIGIGLLLGSLTARRP